MSRGDLETIATNFTKMRYVLIQDLIGSVNTDFMLITTASEVDLELINTTLRNRKPSYTIYDLVIEVNSYNHYASIRNLARLKTMTVQK